jgi:hypothetical protein
MYTIILCSLIAIVLYAVLEIREWGFSWDLLPLSIIHGFIGAIIGFFVAWILPMDYKNSQWKESIISLKDNNSVVGHFYLGSGQISGKMVYVYYQKDDDQTYQMYQADYWKCKIRYTKSSPQIIVNDVSFEKNEWNKWAIDVASERKQTYIFEIPVGKIILHTTDGALCQVCLADT